jgi:hypothetical protein
MSSAASKLFQRLLIRRSFQSNHVFTVGTTESFIWIFPLTVLGGWLIWPAMDQEYMLSMGLVADPEAGVKAVQAARDKRMEAAMLSRGLSGTAGSSSAPKKKKVVEEEEEEEEEEAGEDAEEEEGEGGDDGEEEGEEEEEEEEPKPKAKPLYLPTKGKKLTKAEMWDNFTIKAVRMSEDDDDDDEDEEEDDE